MLGRLSAFLAGAAVGGAGGYVMLRQDMKAASSTVTAAVATLAGRVRFFRCRSGFGAVPVSVAVSPLAWWAVVPAPRSFPLRYPKDPVRPVLVSPAET